ncbi:MAG: hypothetical protein EA372_03820 [Chromatiaceae bacterium]|nr:MAG: hypothetical protein EA372_03820 [Chromatiaceae bacterium]
MKRSAEGGLRMDAVMYMAGALETLENVDKQQLTTTVFARLGKAVFPSTPPPNATRWSRSRAISLACSCCR